MSYLSINQHICITRIVSEKGGFLRGYVEPEK
jgi:hypothetical protein